MTNVPWQEELVELPFLWYRSILTISKVWWIHLRFQITPEPEIHWSEVGVVKWPRNSSVTYEDSIIRVLLQHLSITCANKWRNTMLHLCNVSNEFCCCNSGITCFFNTALYRIPVMGHVCIPLDVTSSKKQEPRLNVPVTPYHTVTFLS